MINLKPTKFKAISELVGGGISGADDGTLMVYHDGQTPPTEAEIDAKYNEMIKAWNDSEYQRDRKIAYPSIADQLDKIYHSGIDEWKKDIKAVKDKFPKP